jgi:hypothetical protein
MACVKLLLLDTREGKRERGRGEREGEIEIEREGEGMGRRMAKRFLQRRLQTLMTSTQPMQPEPYT